MVQPDTVAFSKPDEIGATFMERQGQKADNYFFFFVGFRK